MEHIIAVYGTLKKGFGNHYLIEQAEYLGEDYLPFKAIQGTGFPITEFDFKKIPTTDKYLKVELYKVTDLDQLKSIDALEGHPNWYQRKFINTLSGKTVEVYNMFNTIVTEQEKEFFVEEKDGKKFFNWTK